MLLSINFSNFTPRSLNTIEATGRFCRQLGSTQINAACLVAGMCQVDSHIVSTILQKRGYDFNASMQRLAATFNNLHGAYTESGLYFSQEVETAFQYCTTTDVSIDLPQLLDALLRFAPTELICHLVKATLPTLQQTANRAMLEKMPQASASARNPQDDSRTTGTTIKKYCVNMLQLAAEGKIHRAIGRDEDVERVLLILTRKSKNNPVLVGDPGIGKTAIAEELAIRLLNNEVPSDLRQLKLYSLDFTSIKAAPDSVNIMKSILDEASNDPHLVLFIDEIHMLISTCSCSDNDIANLLKPAMARGEIKIFGATTFNEYKIIEEDPAFERRFQKVTVNEPDIESAIKIVQGSKNRFEKHHNISIPDEVCKIAVTVSARYITNRKLPDKAFDLIDEAAANLRLHDTERHALATNDVLKIVTAWTGIPVDDLDENEFHHLQNIEHELRKSVIGQDQAIKVVANAIRRSRMGFGDPARPIGSFLFLGTTGTGKTELCKAIAKFLFNDSDKMVRIDMSEYQQEHSTHRLFGPPPGYIGYDKGGQLTEAVHRKPFCVILFDEIEKAHPKVFETLLQVLDDGRMTDGKGQVVNFKNTIIVMTSNLGQRNILDALCGQDATEEKVMQCTNLVMQKLRMKIAPEFLNRIDSIVMFRPLSHDDIVKITELNLKKEQNRLLERDIEIIIEPEVIQYIANIGYQPEYGARPIKRAITDYIVNPLTTHLIDGALQHIHPITVQLINNQIRFTNA